MIIDTKKNKVVGGGKTSAERFASVGLVPHVEVAVARPFLQLESGGVTVTVSFETDGSFIKATKSSSNWRQAIRPGGEVEITEAEVYEFAKEMDNE